MKKQFYLIVVLCMVYTSSYAQSLESDPAYIKAKQNVAALRQNLIYAKRGAKRGAVAGAIAGGAVGVGVGYSVAQEKYKQLQAQDLQRAARIKPLYMTSVVGGSGVINAALVSAQGAVLGAAIGEAKRRYVIWYINDSLSRTKYNFMTMPMDLAIMAYAAYQQNMSLMKKMKPHVEQFLDDRGVWSALAELYFKQMPVFANLEKLKKQLEK